MEPLAEQDRMTLAIAYEFSEQPAESRTQILQLTELSPQKCPILVPAWKSGQQEFPLCGCCGRPPEGHPVEPEIPARVPGSRTNPAVVRKAGGRAQDYETAAAVNRQQANPWEWPPLDLATLEFAEPLSSAEKLIQEAIKYQPRFARAHYYMGQLLKNRAATVMLPRNIRKLL